MVEQENGESVRVRDLFQLTHLSVIPGVGNVRGRTAHDLEGVDHHEHRVGILFEEGLDLLAETIPEPVCLHRDVRVRTHLVGDGVES